MHIYLKVFLVTLALGLLTWRVAISKRSSSTSLLPPGPPGDPIIGHVRIVPPSRPELSYEKWGREFSKTLVLHTLSALLTLVRFGCYLR
jgi:hypothetical protein